jgi:hypothetical protein
VDKNGATLREALIQAIATGSKAAAADIEGPEFPLEAAHVWQLFLELHGTRTSNGFGLNPISYTEIDAYNRLYGYDVSPEELYLLKVADSAALEQIAENNEREKNL